MLARTTQFALVSAVLLGSHLASAEEAAPDGPASADASPATEAAPPLRLDAAPAVALPMGDLASATGPALGGLVGGSYAVSDVWDVVGHLGYLAGATTSVQVSDVSLSSSLSYAPLLGGARYYFTDAGLLRPYAMGELGAVLVVSSASASAQGASGSGSASNGYLCSALSLGAQIDILDLRAGLFTADVTHADTATSALLTLGVRFASF